MCVINNEIKVHSENSVYFCRTLPKTVLILQSLIQRYIVLCRLGFGNGSLAVRSTVRDLSILFV